MCLNIIWISYILINYNLIYGIPVFSVLSKMDKCDLAYIEIGKKKKVEIDVENILICINYQPNQNPDSRYVEIEFLTKVHKISLNQSFINLIKLWLKWCKTFSVQNPVNRTTLFCIISSVYYSFTCFSFVTLVESC